MKVIHTTYVKNHIHYDKMGRDLYIVKFYTMKVNEASKMKKIKIVVLIILMITQTGCDIIHTENYNGNNIYNIRASGRILELEDHTIYFTIAK